MRTEVVHSVCPHDCPSSCALELTVAGRNQLLKVRGQPGHSYTAGVACAKVVNYRERQHHPDRLGVPLQRVGDKGVGRAAFREMSWDGALDLVAERLQRAAARDGPESVWPHFYAGAMGLVARDGINRLAHAMRYSRQHSTICNTLFEAGWTAGAGPKANWGVDAREIPQSDLVVMWGGNPVSTQVNLMKHIARARSERGACLVVIDPYRTDTAAMADLHLAPRPGTDGALACAAMHVLFREGYADRAYLERYCAGTAALEAHLRTRDPAWASAITGLAVDEIVRFARLYGATRRSYIRLGYGFSRARNGAAQVFAASCLPAVTGAWQYPGGGALHANRGAYVTLDRTLIEGTDVCDRSVRALDQSRIGPILTGARRDLGAGPPVTALLIQDTNPMVVSPDTNAVRAGLQRKDLFVCVHEQFMTETAAMADVVLPAATFLEHDDLYAAAGHTFLQVAKAALDPFAQAKPNHFVICELARRLGARHRGFAMSEREIIDSVLADSGLPGFEEIHRMGGYDLALPFERMHFLDGFGHADRRFHFEADWARIGPEVGHLPALPDHVACGEPADALHPFRLITPPARSFLNSTFSNVDASTRREGEPRARIHGDDLRGLGLEQGGWVRLGNARGSVLLRAQACGEGQQRGVVVVEGLWPNSAFAEGTGINSLVSAEAGLPNGGATFHDVAVWVRAAKGPAED
ncbi:MAG: molybdopterin oxidoreductase family protein [Pseudomonadota bacterium]